MQLGNQVSWDLQPKTRFVITKRPIAQTVMFSPLPFRQRMATSTTSFSVCSFSWLVGRRKTFSHLTRLTQCCCLSTYGARAAAVRRAVRVAVAKGMGMRATGGVACRNFFRFSAYGTFPSPNWWVMIRLGFPPPCRDDLSCYYYYQ